MFSVTICTNFFCTAIQMRDVWRHFCIWTFYSLQLPCVQKPFSHFSWIRLNIQRIFFFLSLNCCDQKCHSDIVKEETEREREMQSETERGRRDWERQSGKERRGKDKGRNWHTAGMQRDKASCSLGPMRFDFELWCVTHEEQSLHCRGCCRGKYSTIVRVWWEVPLCHGNRRIPGEQYCCC